MYKGVRIYSENKNLNFILLVRRGEKTQSYALGREKLLSCESTTARSPLLIYSTHLNLPNNHSPIILIVTKVKKVTILIIKPDLHITIGVNDIIINSKSRIKKIIQKIKNRKDTGSTLTLKESKPHSKVSALILLLISNNLKTPIILGTIKEINKYKHSNHINNLINK